MAAGRGLKGVCEPGCESVSPEQAYWQVKGRLELQVVDLGPQTLKNIAEPVRAYLLRHGPPMTQKAPGAVTKPRGVLGHWPALATALVVALLAAGGYVWHAGYATRLLGASIADDKLKTGPRLSIVVLPFENLSGDKEQDYFADGITDDLTTDLSHLPDSFVISRGTAFTYKGKPVDTKQIGRELGVRYVLEGQRAPAIRHETITVNAQLHLDRNRRACVGRPVRRGTSGRLGELQVEVVSSPLANSLGVELVKAEALRAARERPEQPGRRRPRDAWVGELVNTGFASKTNFDAAIADFERALQLDPELTRAQLGFGVGELVDRAFFVSRRPCDRRLAARRKRC